MKASSPVRGVLNGGGHDYRGTRVLVLLVKKSFVVVVLEPRRILSCGNRFATLLSKNYVVPAYSSPNEGGTAGRRTSVEGGGYNPTGNPANDPNAPLRKCNKLPVLTLSLSLSYWTFLVHSYLSDDLPPRTHEDLLLLRPRHISFFAQKHA